MSFLLDVLTRHSTPDEIKKAFSNYNSYLESIRKDLPASAYDFAVASWHYNHDDHQCPHDSWLESLAISEPSSGSRHEKRRIAIEIRLLGAYHDGYLELSYPDVKFYSLFARPNSSKKEHGDWLVDEIRLSDENLVLHEILFSSGSRWIIESDNILFRWEPAVVSPSS